MFLDFVKKVIWRKNDTTKWFLKKKDIKAPEVLVIEIE